MSLFVEYSYASLNKKGEELCGDRVEIFRNKEECIAVLSDGLGSGVKANILSTLTSKIAITMLKEGLTIEEVVDTVTHTLPVCKVRDLAYSTFTIVQIDKNGLAYIVEFDNPGIFFIRNKKLMDIESRVINVNGKNIKESRVNLIEGDTLVFVSDGAIHAGVGNLINFGWGWNDVAAFIEDMPHFRLSSKEITNRVIDACNTLYMEEPGDDTTVVTLKAISPKEVSIFSGPPKSKEKDKEIVKDFIEGKGKKIVCGGTAANIVARELGVEIQTSLDYFDKDIPPTAKIAGIELVTEGVLTIRTAIKLLSEINTTLDISYLYKQDGASKLAKCLFEESTHVKLLVGKAINPAHQNPNFPEELSIKFKLLLELKRVLEELGKIVTVKYY